MILKDEFGFKTRGQIEQLEGAIDDYVSIFSSGDVLPYSWTIAACLSPPRRDASEHDN